jgi:hypothetical protein
VARTNERTIALLVVMGSECEPIPYSNQRELAQQLMIEALRERLRTSRVRNVLIVCGITDAELATVAA